MNTEQTLSETFLHRKPENWNCAQSLFKGFQEQLAIPDAEIERARWKNYRLRYFTEELEEKNDV